MWPGSTKDKFAPTETGNMVGLKLDVNNQLVSFGAFNCSDAAGWVV